MALCFMSIIYYVTFLNLFFFFLLNIIIWALDMLLNINLIIHFNCIKMFCHTIHYELYIHFLIDLKCFPFFTIMCNKFAHMPEFFLGINQGVRLLDQTIAHFQHLHKCQTDAPSPYSVLKHHVSQSSLYLA